MIRTLLETSLKARITLLTLAIFLASTVCLGLYTVTVLRTDLQGLLTRQQFSLAENIAGNIEEQLRERLQALEQVARLAGPRVVQNDVLAQRMLADLPVFQAQFNGGTFITDAAGTAIASAPLSLPRVGVSYADRDYIQQVLATGRPAIGKPTLGRTLGVPVVVMAVPIRDLGGKIVGVLAGVTNLHHASFLDTETDRDIGRKATYLLVSTEHRLVITSSDKSRVMELVPPAGMNPAIDRYMAGHEGTSTFINPLGVEVLTSVKQVPSANWYVAVALPTAVAFEPLQSLQVHLLMGIALLTLGAGLLSWWMIRRQLFPLQRAAQQLALTRPDHLQTAELAPLPVGRPDEIGQLILSFNTLLAELSRQRMQLQKSELLYSTAFQTSPDAFSIVRLDDGCFLKINESFTRIFGWSTDDLVGRTARDVAIWQDPNDRHVLVQALKEHGRCENLEAGLVTRDGRRLSVLISATLIDFEGEPCMLAVTHDITARKAAQAQIHELAFSDPLTGLPNRRLFMDRLHQSVAECTRHGRRGALYFVDLDDFKSLNDNLGHDKGDLLLRAAGQQLLSIVAPGDTVARLSGDEFVVMIKDLPHEAAQAAAQAKAMGERILTVLSEAVRIDGKAHHGSASAGMTPFGPETVHAADLLKQADLALYQAKSLGRNRLCLFTPDLQARLNSRSEMEADLRVALQQEQFRLHYQVQVDMRGRIVGVEALLRWQHPGKGMVPPGEFISLAEQSGLIVPLGHWVLETACRQLVRWAADPVLSRLSMGVNVSSRQFQQFDFVHQVLATLEKTGADARRLKLELTESLLVDNIEDVATKMKALRARGVCFSLDDFGTGFSSLAYLKSLPLDELKIDQGFVRHIEADPNDMAIARTVVALGQSLGLTVTAEGVETEAQRQTLVDLGCQRCQGYLFGRPAPVEEIEARMKAQARMLESA